MEVLSYGQIGEVIGEIDFRRELSRDWKMSEDLAERIRCLVKEVIEQRQQLNDPKYGLVAEAGRREALLNENARLKARLELAESACDTAGGLLQPACEVPEATYTQLEIELGRRLGAWRELKEAHEQANK